MKLFYIVSIGILSVSTLAYGQTPCGKVNQRACCFTESIFPCTDAAEVAGCDETNSQTGCVCGGANLFLMRSSSHCEPLSPCGKVGERACCSGEKSFGPCEDKLVEAQGCSGDCLCSTGMRAQTMCSTMEPMVEPETAWRRGKANTRGSLRGYMDMHLHFLGHLAFGGAVLGGLPYDVERGVNFALGKQDKNVHGNHGIFGDMTGYGSGDRASSNLGAPTFGGWPTWNSTTHQQSYYKWLERAYHGGLRLITMMAVTNEALCRLTKPIDGLNCYNSMEAIDAQLDEAYRFESMVDWFRIVTTPQQAREVIMDGKLAVVLGIEVDNLFNCKHGDDKNGKCTEQSISKSLDAYYARGVRHIFPIHNFDNAFGAPATWQANVNVGNRAVEGVWWDTEPCPKGYGYSFSMDLPASVLTAGMVLGGFGIVDRPQIDSEPSCHAKGLSSLGKSLISMMMDKGFLIDIDHMSNKSIDDTLTLAEQRRPIYPVVASHVLPLDMQDESTRSERLRTHEQLLRIRDGGGMVALMLKDHAQDMGGHGKRLTRTYDQQLPDDCRHSSKSWAQSYRYMVDVMGGAIALGSDFNGIAAHLGPRFGSQACGGEFSKKGVARERNAQVRYNNRVEYPFTDPVFGSFGQQVTGDKTYDYNVDGLAHIGLLPDFIEDLRMIGLSEAQLEPLFQSAEAYVQVWERASQGASY